MPRRAKLGQKNGHWHSRAGGRSRYYGKVGVVPYAEALRRFREALAKPEAEAESIVSITVADLADRFLVWLDHHRSGRTHEERQRHLKRFIAVVGAIKADQITASHLDAFLGILAKKHAPDYVKKHATSLRAMIRWGIKHKLLPDGFAPFTALEPIYLPPKALLESDLPTRDEYERLLEHAGSYRGLRDLLRVYYATGARTHELLTVRVRGYQPVTHQLVLTNHKRSKTLKEPTPRRIALNAEAEGVIARLCEGRQPEDYIFTRPSGKPWTRHLVARWFQASRIKSAVRDVITVYSFRHLWISEMLMAGVDVMLVARMAGTSVAMIERVYGHFRSQSYQDAQAKLDQARARES